MNPPGSPPSGTPVGPSVLPPHSGAGETAQTGQTSTSQTVSPHHPVEKRIPTNDNPVRSSGLPDNIQPANAPGGTVSQNRPGGAEGIKRDLNKLLADDKPLEQGFRKKVEMKYIDASITALEKIKEEMNGKWDLSNDDLKVAFKKAHKKAIKKLKENNSNDVKVTFNLPGGQRVRLIPPELDNLDLSDLKSWLQGSLGLVNELKSEKQSAYDAGLIEQAITDGARELNTLLSQLAQTGSSEQELLGFQARYHAIQYPIISLSFDGSSQHSSDRPEHHSTPEAVKPSPSIKITNDPERALTVPDEGDSAFGDESLVDADHLKRVERARKAYRDLGYAWYQQEKNTSEEILDDKAMLMAELEQRLQGKPESDDDSGVSVSSLTSPQRSNPRRRSGDKTGEPPSSARKLQVKDDDGVGLFRALFACYTGNGDWQNASKDQVRKEIRDETMAQPIKLAIDVATHKYLELDPYNNDVMDVQNLSQRAVAQKIKALDDQGLLVQKIFAQVILDGTFSEHSFRRLPEVLGVTDLMTNDPDDPYAFEMIVFSQLIMSELCTTLGVPESNGNERGFHRLNRGFGVVLDAEKKKDDDKRNSVKEADRASGLSPAREDTKVMAPSEDSMIPETSGDDASSAVSQPPPPPPPGSLAESFEDKKSTDSR
ncbi:hypothetical protein [Endozoicomonas sp. ALC013]|uniref:hypothetical protein n=1 Tax=Endozoicomonas sp. ALC013 TaxID=3403076 RepID=UPI003BB50A79